MNQLQVPYCSVRCDNMSASGNLQAIRKDVLSLLQGRREKKLHFFVRSANLYQTTRHHILNNNILPS